nr:unnamed protein product [Digitaria exilis]
MADVVMGAIGSLVPKLLKLLKEEYKLQGEAEKRVRSLTVELEAAQAALRKVAQVPWDQLDEQVKLWAREVRESSLDMEDVLDTFFVHVEQQGGCRNSKRLSDTMATLIAKCKARRKISVDVKGIMSHLDEVAARCRRYKVDDIVARPAAAAVDPRLAAMYNKANNLVGIHESSSDLISMLQLHHPQRQKMKIVSVVGVGGLGKTTLAKAVHDKVKGDFACWAFVPVGRNPDLTKVIQAILIDLDRQRYMKFNFGLFHQINQFIDELRKFLHDNKRYFIVIDDIWEVQSWKTLKLAFDDDNSCGDKVPEEIGALKVLQTLDLWRSYIEELPSSMSSLTQLMCLSITFSPAYDSSKAVWLESLTSLEELQIEVFSPTAGRWLVKDLGSLKELRVLKANFWYDEESERELVESLRHIPKLEHLSIVGVVGGFVCYRGAMWEAAGFVLPQHLRVLAAVRGVEFVKLPSCINPWCLPNLSHLELKLEKVDEEDLKILGGFPELRYLHLLLRSSATVSNIVTDSDDAVYFPKLRYWRLENVMVVLFRGNKGDKGVSFHLWDGEDDIAMPAVIAADGDGLLALAYYCLLAFIQHALAFVRKWWLLGYPLISTRGSGPGNGEDAIAMNSASVDENKSSICTKDDTATPRFMPRLQVLHFCAHRYRGKLGLEYLPSVQEIRVDIKLRHDASFAEVRKMEAALSRVANVHPNRPTLHIEKSWVLR